MNEQFMDPYDALINNQYANRVRFIRQVGGQYLGSNFKLASGPTDWRLTLGRYAGRYGGHPVDLHGYWIFHPNANKCWQTMYRGGNPLQYWNEDGKATGNPEDYELFMFQAVNKADRTVKIYNASWEAYCRLTGALPGIGSWVNYVGLVGDAFSCNESPDNAAIFVVEFL